ncbi:MAG: hypothetical protein COU08_02455 [Candidatus Harrisonbacteria bacterium CG10_big_fil_rev_8_21_14_0_10_42_17]|uniref:Glycosyl transferase family 1 domain-containing protein n=1 Tax=Candidatus Harrisonbacteria bacterium CG10_big_fil_rev_8_21_14_0_10_42_17 TaxID=1974584 RepID=A0A2M6WI29_9BACT|nr:MAG: hypothetical protein COU08_02455 [Candidatus Harrisonbacteria bacterium CG10_big_fil_rev_8_21_14_0_10_42_17]
MERENVLKNPKLCYVLPEYSPESHTHFSYIVDFLKIIEKEVDIFLIVEKGDGKKIGLKNVVSLTFHIAPLRIIETTIRLIQARLKGYKTTYIHYSFIGAFLASLIAKVTKGTTFYWNCGLPWNYKRNALRDWFERKTYSLITHLVTGTDSLKKKYAKHYNLEEESIIVLPNWINVEKIQDHVKKENKKNLRARHGIEDNDKVILFIHRLSQRKGAHYLPGIAHAIRDEKTVLLIIGDGPERNHIELTIRNQGLDRHAKFLGWLPHEDALKYFCIADVFIMPSEEEGFPHVLLEAMATGTPFTAFDVGGVKEITPPSTEDYILGEGDIEGFISKTKELLKLSKEKKSDLARSEKNHVKKYDTDDVLKMFKRVIVDKVQ